MKSFVIGALIAAMSISTPVFADQTDQTKPVTILVDNRGLSCDSRIAEGVRIQNRSVAWREMKRLRGEGKTVKIVTLESGDHYQIGLNEVVVQSTDRTC